jgi:pantoate--beta-alanine ligase
VFFSYILRKHRLDVISDIKQLTDFAEKLKNQGKSIGFVPTMGALHDGHLALVSKSIAQNDITICSIFINPLQFNKPEDLLKYPVDLEGDLKKLQDVGCQIAFTPNTKEFYPVKPLTELKFGSLSEILEGEFRPGHFSGMAIVVARLINLSRASKAYFGLKDLQQFLIVKRMCMDLAVPCKIIPCEIIREGDGLAMSSRNRRLGASERKIAPKIYKLLCLIRDECLKSADIESAATKINPKEFLGNEFNLEYLELIKLPEFEKASTLDSNSEYAICIAAYISGIRLIDNIIFKSL